MSFSSPQRSPSKDNDYPPPEKPVEGGGGEHPPQKQKTHRQNQQQQKNNNPDRHHSTHQVQSQQQQQDNNPDKHQIHHRQNQQQQQLNNNPDRHHSTHHVQNQQQQQDNNPDNPDKHQTLRVQNLQQHAEAAEVVPRQHVSRNNNPERQKDNQNTLNSLDIHSSSNQESKYNSLRPPSGKVNDSGFPGNQSPEKHHLQQKSPVSVINPEEYHRKTSNNLPKNLKDPPEQDHQTNDGEPKLQPVAEKRSQVDEQRSSVSLQKQNNGDLMSREPLPVPEGYPPSRPPTSPSKLEPRRKKGLLEKICPCCF